MGGAYIARPAPVAAKSASLSGVLRPQHSNHWSLLSWSRFPDKPTWKYAKARCLFGSTGGAVSGQLSLCASRIPQVLGDYPCEGPADLYDAVRRLPWENSSIRRERWL